MRSFIWVIILIVCGLVDINAVVIKDTIPPDSLRMVQLGEVVKVAKLTYSLGYRGFESPRFRSKGCQLKS